MVDASIASTTAAVAAMEAAAAATVAMIRTGTAARTIAVMTVATKRATTAGIVATWTGTTRPGTALVHRGAAIVMITVSAALVRADIATTALPAAMMRLSALRTLQMYSSSSLSPTCPSTSFNGS